MRHNIPEWVNQHIGVPFVDRGRTRAGCDCYGLVRLVLVEQTGMTLPEFGACGQSTNKQDQSDMIAAKRDEIGWRRIEKGSERVFDVAEITDVYKNADGKWDSGPLHTGIVVAPGWLLHTRAATDSRLERYDVKPLSSAVSCFWRLTDGEAG